MISPLPGTANEVPRNDPRLGDAPLWLLIGPALAASLGAYLLALTVGPTLAAMRRDLGLPISMALWIFAAYLLPAALAVAVGAPLGRRAPTAVTSAAITLLVAGSLLTTLVPSGGALLLGRAVTGFGAGLAWAVAATLIVRVRTRAVWVAPFVAGAVVIALLLGPVIGALLTRAVGWRWPFMLAVPFELVALLVTAVSGIIALTRRASRPAQPPIAPSA